MYVILLSDPKQVKLFNFTFFKVFPEVITPLTMTTVATVLNSSTSELLTKEKDYYSGLFSVGFFNSNYRVTFDMFKVKLFSTFNFSLIFYFRSLGIYAGG